MLSCKNILVEFDRILENLFWSVGTLSPNWANCIYRKATIEIGKNIDFPTEHYFL